MKKSTPHILVATGYPLHGDAFRAYLHGYYGVHPIQHHDWNPGLGALQRELGANCPAALVVDDTFPYPIAELAACVRALQPNLGMIYLDANPNIFRVLHGLECGVLAYLYLGDELAESLRTVVDAVRRRERYLSPSIRGLYERYTLYRGVFEKLPPRLKETFKLMGEGLTAPQIRARLGIKMSVVYRRQYRLRKYFGVETNEELVEILRGMYQ